MKTNSNNSSPEAGIAPPPIVSLVANALAQIAKSDNPAILAGLSDMVKDHVRLVDIHGLGSAVFGEDAAPSLNTLRLLTKRQIIPHFRIGKLIRYDPRLVRAALEQRCLIQARKSGGAK